MHAVNHAADSHLGGHASDPWWLAAQVLLATAALEFISAAARDPWTAGVRLTHQAPRRAAQSIRSALNRYPRFMIVVISPGTSSARRSRLIAMCSACSSGLSGRHAISSWRESTELLEAKATSSASEFGPREIRRSLTRNLAATQLDDHPVL